MIELPPMPTWDGLHPLIIHFPIALLLVAPIFILMGILFRRNGIHFLASAFILMLLGTISIYFAVETGEAAGELADRTPQVMQVMQHHEELAGTTRLIFTALTFVFAAVLLGQKILKRPAARVTALALYGSFLILYMAGTMVLVNTAHNGGRMVHELGVHALMGSAGDNSSAAE